MKKYIIALLLLGSCVSEAGISIKRALRICKKIEQRYKDELVFLRNGLISDDERGLLKAVIYNRAGSRYWFAPMARYHKWLGKDIYKLEMCLRSNSFKVVSSDSEQAEKCLNCMLKNLNIIKDFTEMHVEFITEKKAHTYQLFTLGKVSLILYLTWIFLS